MQCPLLIGVPVDYRDDHRLMEIVHPEALNRMRQSRTYYKHYRLLGPGTSSLHCEWATYLAFDTGSRPVSK